MNKKFIAKTLALVTALTCAFSIASCSNDNEETKAGEYRLLGTVTHGNLFFLSKNDDETFQTKADLMSLVGKTVGVVNLKNVPGLMLKIILEKNDVPFVEVESTDDVVADKVNLIAIGADNAAGTITATSAEFDCYVAADPLVTMKTKAGLYRSGSLQNLYGEDGYPQAVLVGKCEFTEKYPAFTEKLLDKLANAETYLQTSETSAILSTFTAAYEEDSRTGSWNAKNLNATSIANCNVKFEAAQACKTAVTTIVGEMYAVQGQTAPSFSDAFFYTAKEESTSTAEELISTATPDQVTVYCPDGAPALVLAELMANSAIDGVNVTVKIVSADTIGTYVSYKGGETGKNADFCVMPVNLAAKLLAW